MKKTRTRRHFFTLLEIVVCVAILTIAGATLGWQMKNMISAHYFYKNIDHLFTDLQKCQLIALSDRTDIEMKIFKEKETYVYQAVSDTPIPCFLSKPMKLIGVKEVRKNQRVVDKLILTIYSSGRIEPCQEIEFIQDEKGGVILDLKTPLLVELKRKESL